MKNSKVVLLSLIFVLSIWGCSKDGVEGPAGPQGPAGPAGTSTPDARLFTKWDVVSGGDLLTSYSNYTSNYVILKSDYTMYILEEEPSYGFHLVESALAVITNLQVHGFGTYNYSFNSAGDVLTLNNPTYGSVVLHKDTTAPDETQWVTKVHSIESFNVPSTSSYYSSIDNLASDGQYLYVPDDGSSASGFYRITSSSHTSTLVNTYNGPSYYYSPSVAASNGILWVADGSYIHKIDRITGYDYSGSTGYLVNSSGSDIYGMGCNSSGSTVYCYDSNGDIYAFNTLSNTPNLIVNISASVTGIEYVGGYLYIGGDGMIHKCTLSPFQCVASYEITSPINFYFCGLANDGANFWIMARDYYYGTTAIHKLNF